MNKEIEQYKKAVQFLLENDHGLSIQSDGTIYIRSLEGDKICVGRVDIEYGIKEEKVYTNDFDSAFQHFFTMKVNERLGSIGFESNEP